MKRAVLAVVLVIAFAMPALADFDKGVVAYKRGDYDTALRELRPLADLGDVGAQYLLGVMYDKGRGVRQDYAEAVKWYRKAAEQGNVSAQFNLADMYQYGEGVPQDFVQAHMWFSLAAAQNNEGARKSRNTIEKKMTPADVSKAQQMAREWFEKHPK